MPKDGFKRNNKITICKRSIHFYQIMEAKRFKINDWLIMQKRSKYRDKNYADNERAIWAE